jgi:superfamily II RNA helicase
MTNYPKGNEEKYKESFQKYPYELSIFQKHAIEAIIEGHHVLVTAHTGSGKTLAGEFAIEHFVAKGKKVIYTGPIKSLINQKFNDFSKKYERISFGILTGDVKVNPEADVLVMTAEILLNKLYQLNSKTKDIKSSVNFEMDFDNDLICVIMDEVHFVNEPERGHVWETTLMMLPSHVQLVMLSATIDQPENFAYWCENIHKDSNKQVYLTNTTHRVVPLTHYSFITTNNGIFKAIKDKSVHEEIKSIINKPFIIQCSNGKFNDDHFFKMTNMLKLLNSKEIRVKRAHILNQVTKYLTEKELLPALCFVLSRKKIDICANEITTNLLEFDSKVPYIIDRECEQLLRSKLPNYEEYLHLPEYINMVSLLRKGIAIHHSGVLPILKEIVELLYAKGYIKLLFATETFSIGVNMPTKTVIFTDVNKFDGTTTRLLFSHEMSQMSGRAGRRGIDKIGTCIHLNNLFRNVDHISYKTMMNGKPQKLVSKFKISYNLLLNLLDTGDTNLVSFAKRSMTTSDIDAQLGTIYYAKTNLQIELDNATNFTNNLRTSKNILQEYIDIQKNSHMFSSKKKKEVSRKMKDIEDNNKFLKQDLVSYNKISQIKDELNKLEKEEEDLNKYFHSGVKKVLDLLTEEEFIDAENVLTMKGKIATQLRETHCLIFANLIFNNKLDHLSSSQLVALFSCFTNISVQEERKAYFPNSKDNQINEIVNKVTEMYTVCQDIEQKREIHTGIDYTIHYDLLNYLEEWCCANNIDECKLVLQKIGEEKEIFLGEFVKALLKINNISCEMEKIAEITGNIAFLSKLKEIETMILKYVVTNQSLYV